MDLYFGGAEQGMWRDLLYANGVRHMSLSFMGLRRRVKRLDLWRLDEKFPEDVLIFVDSGAFTLNKPGSQITASEAEALEHDYRRFVEANIHRLEFASEFDANVLGHDAIFSTREEFWHRMPERKWMPVWHADYGTSNLVALGDSYSRVGVLQDDAGGDLTLTLNRMAGQTRLHGVSMTRQDMMEGIRWSSVGSARWLAVTQYGETFVWTGRELKDYPKKNQDQGRKRHRTWLAEQGFDTEKIEGGDSKELLRLSIWSWQKYADHLNGVTTMPETPSGGNQEQTLPPVAIPFPYMGNEQPPDPAATVEVPRERQLLPVIGFDYQTITETGEDGEQTERTEARMTTPSTTLLQCNTCFMRDKCPAQRQDQECVYDIPVQIRTPAQLDALQAALVEMQAQRVLIMRMIEQREGGYADPNLTTEMSRLWKMLQDRGADRDTVKLTLEAGGQQASAGMISRIFGERAGERLAALEGPRDTQNVIEVLEAEVIDDRG
jgi:hypothetical protein